MYPFFRSLLFKLDPESAHGLTLNLLRLAGSLPPTRWLLEALFAAPSRPVEAFGLSFRNPVGLAAGYDKDALAVRALATLGFGHLELGTVTPLPQPGNPRPRIFRLVEDEAVINRMGFPSQGMLKVESRLLKAGPPPRTTPLGINLGKNKDTPIEEAARDYLLLMRRFLPLADFLTLNISSPNTAGLRRLQGRALLEGMLNEVARERRAMAREHPAHVPILVKLSPDLDDHELEDALDVILRSGMDGVLVTNTTLGRSGLRSDPQESGGLSGRPLARASERMLEQVVRRLGGRLPVVSAGGILSPGDAKRRLEMGAALVQLYTGLVYAGPGLVRKIIRAV